MLCLAALGSLRPDIGITLFFFSTKRRHTRCLSDWSSDVCPSDLLVDPSYGSRGFDEEAWETIRVPQRWDEARSEERRVGKSVDLGGRRIIKKKKNSNLCGGGEGQDTFVVHGHYADGGVLGGDSRK